MKLDPIQQAAQAQFALQSRNYGAGHILADVSDVAAADTTGRDWHPARVTPAARRPHTTSRMPSE